MELKKENVSVRDFLDSGKSKTNVVQDFLSSGTKKVKTNVVQDFLSSGTKKVKTNVVRDFLNLSKPKTNVVQDFLTSKEKTSVVQDFLSTKTDVVQDFLKSKTQIPVATSESITRILFMDLSEDAKVKLIKKIAPKKTLGQWLWTVFKSIVWGVGIVTFMGVVTVAAYAAYTGGGWWLLLQLLYRYLPTAGIPGFLINTLAGYGITLAATTTVSKLMDIASKNETVRKVLDKKLKVPGLKMKLEDTTVRGAVSSAVGYGARVIDPMLLASLASGDYISVAYQASVKLAMNIGLDAVFPYAVSGVTYVVGKTKEGVQSISVKNVVRAATHVSRKILQTTELAISDKAVDALVETVLTTEEKVYTSTKPSLLETLTVKHKKTTATETVLAANKVTSVATAVGTALTTAALAGSAVYLGAGVANSFGIDLIRDTKQAQVSLITFLLNHYDVNFFSTFSTSSSKNAKLKSLAAEIKLQKNQSAVRKLSRKLLFLMTGGPTLSAVEIKNLRGEKLMSVYKLLDPEGWRIAKRKRLQNSQIRELILDLQEKSTEKLKNAVIGVINTSTKVMAAALLVEAGHQAYSYLNSAPGVVDQAIQKNAEELQKEQADRIAQKAKEQAETSKQARAEEVKKYRSAAKAAKTSAAAVAAKAVAAEARAQRLATRLYNAELANARRAIRDAALADTLSSTVGSIISTPTGELHPLPPENLLLDKRLADTLEGINFTPLLVYLTKEVAKSKTSLIPGVGWIAEGVHMVNRWTGVAETVKDVVKIADVLMSVHSATPATVAENLSGLDQLLSKRVPSLDTVIDEFAKNYRLNAKDVVLRAIKDGIVEGWSKERIAMEIGMRITGADVGVSAAEHIGSKLWKTVFGN